jgi:transcriptional regulator with XRE-family HTH domain
MATLKHLPRQLGQADVDRLRREFADRLNLLIGDDKNERNLENFAKKTGISVRQLSQWRNQRHLNWPNVKNLIALSNGAGVSIDWLVVGKELYPEVRRKAGGER